MEPQNGSVYQLNSKPEFRVILLGVDCDCKEYGCPYVRVKQITGKVIDSNNSNNELHYGYEGFMRNWTRIA